VVASVRASTAPVAAETLPADVLAAYGLAGLTAERELGGLINRTFLVRDAGGAVRAVVQRLHPIFGPEVNLDIDAVTRHVAAKGMITPRLIRTTEGAPWFELDGAIWRAITWIDGVTVHAVPDAAHAEAAGRLVGRFHRALSDLDHEFAFRRPSVHDTAGYLENLASAVRTAATAERGVLAEATETARRILDAAARLAPLGDLPLRAVHGDLKISNVLFAPGASPPRAVCLIDLDTLGRQTIAYELGDALRSWCNPAGEDVTTTTLDLDRLAGAMVGYADGADGLLRPNEVEAILPGLETVAVELAARFCVDAFEDRYFGWDPERFATRRHHNLVRAQGQLALAHAVASSRAAARGAIARAFEGRQARMPAGPR
jgi:Ser/Thr protein kinase RdoA (MazF antagonist)